MNLIFPPLKKMNRSVRLLNLARPYATRSTILPNFQGVTSATTLGEVYDRAVVKYKYRLAYPILAWIGFLWYNLWIP